MQFKCLKSLVLKQMFVQDVNVGFKQILETDLFFLIASDSIQDL